MTLTTQIWRKNGKDRSRTLGAWDYRAPTRNKRIGTYALACTGERKHISNIDVEFVIKKGLVLTRVENHAKTDKQVQLSITTQNDLINIEDTSRSYSLRRHSERYSSFWHCEDEIQFNVEADGQETANLNVCSEPACSLTFVVRTSGPTKRSSMSEDLNSLRQMTDKVNELAAEYSALEDALEELNSELSSGNHDIGRILQLKTERRKQMRMIEFEACDMLMSIYPESVDVADLVEDIHENAPTSASEKGVEVAKQLKLSETVIEKISKEKKAIVGWLFEFVRAAINSIS